MVQARPDTATSALSVHALTPRLLRLAWALFKLALAVFVLVIGLLLLRDAIHGKRVEAAFTRAGGPTRVETAVEASRFWLRTPAWVVTVRAHAGPKIMWGAARCALVLDAPLLFIPRKHSAGSRLFLATIRRWRKNPTPRGHKGAQVFRVSTENSLAQCMSNSRSSNASGLSTFEAGGRLHLPLPEVGAGKKLAPVVVLAAAKGAGDAPDVGVALALAGHLATAARKVSLVVVPRYLEGDPELEDQLRKQRGTVEGGVLLGQTGILSEDTRALLRQIVAARDTRGILGEARTDVDALKAVLAALLAVFGFGAAARAAPEAGQRLVETFPERVREPVRRRYVMARDRMALDRSPDEDALIGALDEGHRGQEVTVWLRSGGTVSGFVEQQKRSTGVLRLRRATVVHEADPADSAADLLLVPLDDIALIGAKVESPSTTSSSPIRRAGFRLAAELVATLTGKQPPALKRSRLLKAIRNAEAEKELAIPNDEDHVWDELRRLLINAWEARDLELYSALCAVEDSLQLAQQKPDSEVARKNLLKVLAELSRISSRPTAATRPRRATGREE